MVWFLDVCSYPGALEWQQRMRKPGLQVIEDNFRTVRKRLSSPKIHIIIHVAIDVKIKKCLNKFIWYELRMLVL